MEKERSTNPIFLCSGKEYHALKENVILVGNPKVIDANSQNRKIYYDILTVGKNIRHKTKNDRMTIRLTNTKKNTIFIMIHRKYLNMIDNIQINRYSNGSKRNSLNSRAKYGVLMVCTSSEH